ncbi:hypothetical protein NQ315_009885 [Exocentrus adspersus]|uniref:DUF4781 domain-containing protein n=1 Tax=Exocentrus adspersus TaxID=1586481 RepID=A0AAV8WIM9_9CUCU|nr:hypothetical protein NQ315_009885 [Exocentrus adspersus]
MDKEDCELTFSLVYGNREDSVQLSERDSVEKLKARIQALYGISPDKQVIDGWRSTPNDDNSTLQDCAETDSITRLVIKSAEGTSEDEEMEVEAAVSFITKVMNKYDNTTIQFHACKLRDAINEACMRRALCLYLHNEKDKFSTILCENLRRPEVIEILTRNFFFLGYDVEERHFQSALLKALHRCRDLSSLIPMVEAGIAAAVCVVPIQDSVTIFSCIRGKVSNKDFLVALSNTENFLIVENQQEKNLEELREITGSENDIGSTNYQKLMADMLGDRDWDRFEEDQHEYLKKKIAFALLGPPQKEEGYERKDIKKVQALYESILKSNNEITKYPGRVEVAFIYNCTEPLPSEKMSRAKKYKEYNPNTDVMPLPIFALRRCHGSVNPCRIFIDNIGRTYQTWHDYIVKNKFHQCEMILPLNGRYEINEKGEVLLERHLSPACGVDSKLLQGADYLSTAGGLISGGIFVAAAIPTIAVAPAALIAGGVIGLGVGIYSMGRSAYTLYDRKKHKETLTFANSEARGAYLSILAGSLGFVGAGATVAVSQLASVGVNIGQGAGAAIKTIGFVNIGASGVSMLNSGYDVIDNWIQENKATSLLTIIQLKSSILFFGNVIHHVDSKDIDEVQAKTMQSYQESLRNNRLRKPLLILQKTAQEEGTKQHNEQTLIISPVVKIPSKDEILAVLGLEDDYTSGKSISFTITDDDEIKLNNHTLDLSEVLNINARDTSVFLSGYFMMTDLTPKDEAFISDLISQLVQVPIPDRQVFTIYVTRLLHCFSNEHKTNILNALAFILKQVTSSIEQTLDEIFNQSKYLRLVDVAVCFFGKKSQRLKDRWRTWLSTRKDEFYLAFFEHVDEEEVDELEFFEKAVDMCYQASSLTKDSEEELRNYFFNWLARQVYDNQERMERAWRKRKGSSSQPREKVPCSVCGGYFYRTSKNK